MRARMQFATAIFTFLAAFLSGEEIARAPNGIANVAPRLTVFISDLHLGVGRDPLKPEQWHAMEDFRWKEEFVLFLKEVDKVGGGKTDLILNGDTFELWQSLKDDCRYSDRDLGCTEAEAIGRIQRVIAAHAQELEALGGFARSQDNRLIIVPGNHDAALLFPGVREAVLQAIPAQGRVTVLTAGSWRSPDNLIYAEHGHQIGKEVNKWESWPQPFIESAGRKHLQRPWGERFVQEYYNELEVRYTIIDNISVEGEGIRYARAAEGNVAAVGDIAGFVNFFLFKVSSHQFTTALGDKSEDLPPEWDLEKIRSRGAVFFVESLPQDHSFFEDAKAALEKGELASSFKELSDKDIKAICDERATLVKLQSQITTDQKVTVTECPRKEAALGATTEYLLRSRDAIFTEHLEKTCLNLQGCRERRFKVFVYSHTHLAVPGFLPRKGDWQPLVINTGAWQRIVTPEQLAARMAKMSPREKTQAEKELLLRLIPEDLPACYSVVMVKPYTEQGGPAPVLQYWSRNNETNWGFTDRCLSQ